MGYGARRYDQQIDDEFNKLLTPPAGPSQPRAGTPPPAPGAPEGSAQPIAVTQAISPPPGALAYGWQTAVHSFGAGAHSVMEGLNDIMTPGEEGRSQIRGSAKIVQGVFQMGLGPLLGGPAAAIGQAVENAAPGLAKHVVVSGQTAGVINTMLDPFGSIGEMLESPRSIAKMSDAQLKAFRERIEQKGKPFTFRQAVETAVGLAIPLVAAKAVRGKGKTTDGATEPSASSSQVPSSSSKAPTSASKAGAAASPKTPEVQPVTPEQAQAFAEAALAETEVPPPGTQGPRVFGINWQRLGQEESVNRVILQLNKDLRAAGREAEATRGVRSHEVTTEAAKDLKLTVEKVLDIEPGTAVNAETVTAIRGVRDMAARALRDAIELAKDGDPAAIQDVPTLVALNYEFNLRVRGVAAEAGRALEAHKMPSDIETSGMGQKRFEELVDRMHGLTDAARIAEMFPALKTAGKWNRFVDGLGNAAATGKDIVWEVWVNDLLGPVTLGAKAVGDTIMIVSEGPRRTLARANQLMFPWLFPEKFEHIAPGEGSTFAISAVQRIPNAVMQAIRGVRSGEIDVMTGVGAKPYESKLRGAEVGLTEGSVPAMLVDGLGMAIRAPGTLLGILTNVAKASNYHGASAAAALRQAWFEGLEGEALKARIQYIQEHPAEFPWIADEATATAAYNTFTNDLGPFGEALTVTLNTAHLRSQAPFLRVPINLEKAGTHVVPPFNLPSILWGEMRANLQKGGRARAETMATIEFGAALAGTVAYLTANHIITGYGPRDPVKRQERERMGLPYHSIILGGHAVDLNRIKPVGTMIGLTATVTEGWAQLPNDSNFVERMGQIAMLHALAWGRVIQEASYFTGVKQVVDAIATDSDKPITAGAVGAVKSMARSLPPNTYMRTPNRLYFDNVMRETHTATEAFLSGIPGYSQTLAPHRDVLDGQPFLYPPAFGPALLSPVVMRAVNPDPVRKTLFVDNDMRVKDLPWVIKLTGLGGHVDPTLAMREPTGQDGVELTSHQRDRWKVIMTQEVITGEGTLYQSLHRLILTPKWMIASKELRQDYVNEKMRDYREEARERLLREDPDLRITLEQRHHRHVEGKYLPVTDPRSPNFGHQLSIGR